MSDFSNHGKTTQRWPRIAALLGASAVLFGAAQARRAGAPSPTPKLAAEAAACFECHPEVQGLWGRGKHQGLACDTCHGALAAHLADGSRPTTAVEMATCASCHGEEYRTFLHVNPHRPARLEKSLLTERSPNPLWEKLMAGHAFTKEHAAPRAHAYMLVDHLLVDRAYGGRFAPKYGWSYVAAHPPVKTWELIVDRYPDNNEQKAFQRETAAAANPGCFSCKTSTWILDWKHMGDPDPAARFSRTTNVVEMARQMQEPMGCIHCHDPHATAPRLIKDALIEALTRPEGDTLWHKDPQRTPIEVVDFRGFRKIALLKRADSTLLCAQCHVEYACNPVIDTVTGERVPLADRRTNHFPFVDVLSLYDHANARRYRDFRHATTGALLYKAQHPETEVFWGSPHHRAGVGCADCHMLPVAGSGNNPAKGAKPGTSHWMTSPRADLGHACVRCHGEWSTEEAGLIIDSVKAYTRGRMRKAEYWLGELIDRIAAAQRAGVSAEVLAQARAQHDKAHMLWEWWTAENSDGFHNPDQARESLTRAIEEAKKGIELLEAAHAKH